MYGGKLKTIPKPRKKIKRPKMTESPGSGIGKRKGAENIQHKIK